MDRAAQRVVRRGEIAERVAEDREGDEALPCALIDEEADRAARGVVERTEAEAAGASEAWARGSRLGQDARLSFA